MSVKKIVRFGENCMKGVRLLLLSAVAFLSSCSDNEYVNVIPSKCMALMSVDMQQLGAGENGGADGKALLKKLFGADAAAPTGVDYKSKLYLFEAKDGNMGLVARLESESDFDKLVSVLASKGKCTAAKKRADMSFSLFDGSWLVAYKGHSLMVLGPITPAAQAESERTIAGYFKQDDDQSIVFSPLYSRLDSIGSPIAFVAQAQALPDKFVAPFTIGAPKEADASQVMIAAGVSIADKMLTINGTTYSDDKSIDKALKTSHSKFRPLKADALGGFDSDNAMGLFMDVNGRDFLPMLQQNKGIQTLLVGLNMAIDMDNIVRSVDGPLTIGIAGLGTDDMGLSMTARLANADWLKDVGYWKKSCPAGASITDAGPNAFCYKSGQTSFCFGVSPSLYFYSGADLQTAQANAAKKQSALPAAIQQQIVGKRMAMLLNIKAMTAGQSGTMALAKSVLGNVDYVLYVMK